MASVMHRSSSDGGSSSGWSDAAAAVAAAAEERAGWEVRPSGMVVQARDDAAGPGGAPPRPPPPEIKVRVKYGGARLEVSVSPIATFGELPPPPPSSRPRSCSLAALHRLSRPLVSVLLAFVKTALKFSNSRSEEKRGESTSSSFSLVIITARLTGRLLACLG